MKITKMPSLIKLSSFILAGQLVACQTIQVDTNQFTNINKKDDRPNIILLVTDDQGIGDIGFNQNPIVQTPNIDKLAKEETSLTNFHVDPTCSPTRSALLTGKHSLKAGVWHTILGRYMLGPEHKTIAEELVDAGYSTAIFGKWHLGDNYPYRPQDQGFENVVIHGGGGVGQTPDYWGNTQFDDTYYRNGKPEKFEGYATKIWFDEAINYIKQPHDKPYFAYIALNAPHGPYRAPEAYIKPYEDKGIHNDLASFYGMITYIDEQVARLRTEVEKLGQTDNTLFIYMTDNGSSHRSIKNGQLTAADKKVAELYPNWVPNNGLTGFKGDVYEGGHRVPIIFSYPNGNLKKGELDALTAHYDILPTLLEFAGVKPTDKAIDGQSLVNLLTTGDDSDLAERDIVVTNQRVYHPSMDRPTVVAQGKWRYLRFGKNKTALYDLENDPAQLNNIQNKYPKIAAQMQQKIENWWQNLASQGFKDRYIHVGNPAENPVRLNAMDWMEVPDKQPVPWFIGHQPAAIEYDYTHWITEEDQYQPLPWYINIEQTGKYQVRAYYHDIPAATPILKKYCVVQLAEQTKIAPIFGRAAYCEVNFDANLGKQKIKAWFTNDPTGTTEEKAAFYVYINKL